MTAKKRIRIRPPRIGPKNKTGPKPQREDGWHLTPKGYLRKQVWDPYRKKMRLRLQHDVVWEEANGQIPDGYVVHHINEIKTDNRLENLALLTVLVHSRLHSGCKLIDEVWWKPCPDCGESKPADDDNWYFGNGYPIGRCKPCHIKVVVIKKRARNSKRRAARLAGVAA